MKILYVTTISETMIFFKNFICELVEAGHTVDLACNCKSPINNTYTDIGCKVNDLPFSRNPLKPINISAYKKLRKLVEDGGYDIVHCHTPVAAACTRFACRKARKNGTKVFYTAHGFHFYKGAPLKNWIIYYTVEKLCSYFTDKLITINKEDYELAQNKLKAKSIAYVPGVGIDTAYFAQKKVDKSLKRKEINVPENSFLMLSVGELNSNKNHKSVIEAMTRIDKDVHYVIAGEGNLRKDILCLANKSGLADRVHLLGYRKDVDELYKAADCFVHPSFREGLPVSVMEAIASGLPVIASEIRGNNDLITCETGYLFKPSDINGLCRAFDELKNDISLNKVKYNTEIQSYDRLTINKQIFNLYMDNKDEK